MLLRIFVLILSVSCAPNPFKEDYIHWFLKTHRNPKIDPCENFYRHVCPVAISKNDTLMAIHNEYARSWIQNGKEVLKKEKETLEAILEMGDFASQKPKKQAGRRRRMAFQANENDTNYDVRWSQYAYDQIVYLKYKVVKNLLFTLPFRIAMLYDIRKNRENPLFGEKFTRIEQISLDLMELIVKKVKASKKHTKKFKQHLNEVIQQLTVTMAFIHETDEIVEFYKETVNQLSSNMKEFERLNLTYSNHLPLFDKLTKGLGDFEESLFALIAHTAIPNAQNFNDQVTMAETLFLPNLITNASLSIILGHYGYILGHEIGHSFVQTPYKSPAFARDPTFVKNILCVRRMMEKACILWGESRCNSGLLTMDEDGPDVFGMSSAYTLLKQYLGRNLRKYEYKDLKITKEQLFFYSAAILWCNPYADSQHYPRDVHSSVIIRVNGVYSMMPEFRKAFKCKKHQLMVQPDRCSFYGT